MERTTIGFIRNRLKILSREYRVEFVVDKAYGGYRVTIGQSIDVSPRLKLRELDIWIDGFWAATFRGYK